MKHLRVVFILLLLFSSAVSVWAQSRGSDLEFRVKAVVLFNFAKYVRFPDRVFSTAEQPITVCILGRSPFGDIFESDEAPKDAQGRPLQVVQLGTDPAEEAVGSCQMLYWQEKEDRRVRELLALLQRNSVLTVSDQKSDYAIISFALVDGKVRFRVRRDAAEALGLNISSQLLRLALQD